MKSNLVFEDIDLLISLVIENILKIILYSYKYHYYLQIIIVSISIVLETYYIVLDNMI